MKLVIQIPCLNERATLPGTLAALPTSVDGFDEVEVIVVDDGSTDGTAEVARQHGAHVVRLHGHQGLARAFMAGLAIAVERGADVIVNTDADNQYDAAAIPALARPILDDAADMVIGARPVGTISHFSPTKRLLQRAGSWLVRTVSGAAVADAPSGFRAVSRDAALRLNVFGRFTYTLETVIQAGLNDLRVASIPVRVNPPTRPSRLFRSNVGYALRGARTIAIVFMLYRPAEVFATLAGLALFPGLALGVRYLVLMDLGEGRGHTQSLVACAILCVSGVFFATAAVLAHLLAVNRQLLEELRYLVWSARASRKQHDNPPSTKLV
ncbi:MAG TPA: glycosyltransferase family 2 protein [Gemmataceae bacterium]|nr:glycosyltransferase family 2 protein [Gemmataceae bacterium]